MIGEERFVDRDNEAQERAYAAVRASGSLYTGGSYAEVASNARVWRALQAALDAFSSAPTGEVSVNDDDRQQEDALGLLIRDIYREHGIYTPDQKVADLLIEAGYRKLGPKPTGSRPCSTVTSTVTRT